MSTQSRVRFVRSRVVVASAALAMFLAAFVNGSAEVDALVAYLLE